MAIVERYVDPDVSGGLGDGTSWANAYSSLTSWEAAEQADLVAAGDQHTVYCRSGSGSIDTAALIINGWTTGVENYIQIIVPEEYRHDGKAGTTNYRLSGSIDVVELYVRIEGIECLTGTVNGLLRVSADTRSGSDIRIEKNLIHDKSNVGGASGIDNAGFAYNATIVNNIIYNITVPSGPFSGRHAYGIRAAQGWIVYNNTVYQVNNEDADGDGIGLNASSTALVKNNAVFDCTSVGGLGLCINASATESYSCVSDTSATGTGSLINKSASNQFENITPGSEDLHLKAGSDCLTAGTNLSADPSFPFDDDIDGDTRSNWDIGADEFVSQGGLLPILMNQNLHGNLQVLSGGLQ